MKRSKEFQAESTGLMRRRRIAILFILITDIGVVAWGAMATLLPDYLLGPGARPILQAEYESYTNGSWSALKTTSPAIADFITILFRMYGMFNVVFGLMAVTIAVNSFRRGERWAWWALLVGNTIALGSAITFDRVVNAIGIFEMSEYLGLVLVYVALILTARFSPRARIHASALRMRQTD